MPTIPSLVEYSPRSQAVLFYIDVNALHAFKSRGFSGEIGLVTANSPLAPALFTWAAAWTSALLLIQIKVPRSAPAYAFILCKQSPLQ